MELRALVAEALTEGSTVLLDTSREGAEVLHSLGDGLFACLLSRRTLTYILLRGTYTTVQTKHDCMSHVNTRFQLDEQEGQGAHLGQEACHHG